MSPGIHFNCKSIIKVLPMYRDSSVFRNSYCLPHDVVMLLDPTMDMKIDKINDMLVQQEEIMRNSLIETEKLKARFDCYDNRDQEIKTFLEQLDSKQAQNLEDFKCTMLEFLKSQEYKDSVAEVLDEYLQSKLKENLYDIFQDKYIPTIEKSYEKLSADISSMKNDFYMKLQESSPWESVNKVARSVGHALTKIKCMLKPKEPTRNVIKLLHDKMETLLIHELARWKEIFVREMTDLKTKAENFEPTPSPPSEKLDVADCIDLNPDLITSNVCIRHLTPLDPCDVEIYVPITCLGQTPVHESSFTGWLLPIQGDACHCFSASNSIDDCSSNEISEDHTSADGNDDLEGSEMDEIIDKIEETDDSDAMSLVDLFIELRSEDNQDSFRPPNRDSPCVEYATEGDTDIENSVSSNNENFIDDKVQRSEVPDLCTLDPPQAPATHRQLNMVEKLFTSARIKRLIEKGEYDKAFTEALSCSDLSIVMCACRAADPQRIFATPCCLKQATLLSLTQQLTTDIGEDTNLKCQYIEECIINLDKTNAVSRLYLPLVVQDIRRHLTNFQQCHPGHPSVGRINLILLAANNLVL